jgi:hypothetical protein
MASVMLPIGCLSTAAGQAGAWIGCAVALAVSSVVVLIPITISAATHRWHVDAEGIGGRDHWYVYRKVDWSEIASVSPRLIPGYRYLWVNSLSRCHAFWLPLFLTDMEGFRDAVARYAPPDNPVRRSLEEHLPERSQGEETA